MRFPALRTALAVAPSLLVAAYLAAAPLVRQKVARVAEAVQHRSTALPDRIILTPTADPAHGLAVTWRTDTSVASALAQLALADADPKALAKASTIPAVSVDLKTDLGDARCHSVFLTGLKPGTLYAYRVGDGENWSEWFHVRTASDRPEPFTFIYFGDAQNDVKSLWSRAIRSAYSDAPKAGLLLHAGDLINRANRDAEWGEWHGAGGWVNGMTPSLATPGNHEYEGGKLSRHWRPQFALPENGPPGLEESAYFVDYQGVRFVVLNSEEKIALQTPWLDKVLSENPGRWSVLMLHRPVFAAAQGRDNPELRAAWLPVIRKHRVDLVLQGHDHTYARSQNLGTGLNLRDAKRGTVFVVSVSGPKMYALNRQDWMRRAAEDTQLYQIVHVERDRLLYEARTVTGALYDAFELRRETDGNRLIETGPATPERRRK